jgi:thiazole synthase
MATGSNWFALSAAAEKGLGVKNLSIAGVEFKSRLLIGTGKFPSPKAMAEAVDASGTELVTVALRRVDLENPEDATLAALDFSKYRLLPNTSGARDAAEAVRLAKMARAASGTNWVKLEVTPEPNYLLPDPIETLKAAEQLVAEGFVVLPYMNADPILAKHLEEAGCATVMPLAAPIGTSRGLKTRDQIAIIIEQASVPVVVDAGLGMPSHAAEAIEIGADAVLVNTAIAVAEDPVKMAIAFKLAVQAAEAAVDAKPGGESRIARASSPLTGFLRDEQ